MLGVFRPAVKNARVGSTLTLTKGRTWLEINLANANSWTATQTFVKSALGATVTADAVVLDNTTAATVGVVQVSPDLKWRARAWNTGTSASKTVDFRAWVLPASSTAPSGTWSLQESIDGATYATLFSIDSLVGGRGVTISPRAALSNGSPGTTRHMTFDNTGSYTWTDYRFSGTLRAATGVNSSGAFSIYQSGGNGVDFYACNSGLTSCSLYSYNYATAFVHYGKGIFAGYVGAGSGSTPVSTVQSAGSLGLKVKRYTASATLGDDATHILSDGTTAAACTGTPSQTACSTYTGSGQATCESHLPCVWDAGSSCSAFNYESGMGTCSGTSGCSVDTASCSGPTDQYSCESQDDAYGGSCTWDGTDCSGLPDEGTCSSYSGSGCTANYSDCSTYNDDYSGCTGQAGCSSSSSTDCSAYDGTDQSTCEANSGCYWDGMSNCYMTCSGSYYTGCSGTYYACNGNYNTGSCSGTYGAACTGTVQCGSYSSSGPCAAEAGCAWSSVLVLTLPAMTSVPDRTYFISNDSSASAITRIQVPTTTYPATTINGASYYDLPRYKDGVHVAGAPPEYTQCSGVADESACNALASWGCSVQTNYCSYNSGDNTCSGDAGSICSAHNGDQSGCEAQSYYAGCNGAYYAVKEWRVYTKADTESGTYTPTLTNTTNISASTARLATYMRVGNTVTVSGQLDIDPTAAGAVLLGISLPIASNFSTAYQLGGVGSSIAIANESYGIEADSTNDRASMKNIAVSTANHTVTYQFTYQVI